MSVRQTALRGIHPLRGLRSLQPLRVRSIYRNRIYSRVRSFHSQSITLNDFALNMPAYYLFCQDYYRQKSKLIDLGLRLYYFTTERPSL